MSPILGIWASADQGQYISYGSYDSIATVNPSGSSTVTFSSIPSTYKHLQIRSFFTPTAANYYNTLIFNSDSGANYSYHQIVGDGSNPGSAGGGSTSLIYINNNIGTYGAAAVIDILDYANTSKNKTVRSLGGSEGNGSGYIQFRTGAWYNTAAITTITLTMASGNYSTGSSFALYGIKG